MTESYRSTVEASREWKFEPDFQYISPKFHAPLSADAQLMSARPTAGMHDVSAFLGMKHSDYGVKTQKACSDNSRLTLTDAG
jgi:hypothetical protein